VPLQTRRLIVAAARVGCKRMLSGLSVHSAPPIRRVSWWRPRRASGPPIEDQMKRPISSSLFSGLPPPVTPPAWRGRITRSSN